MGFPLVFSGWRNYYYVTVLPKDRLAQEVEDLAGVITYNNSYLIVRKSSFPT